MARRPLIVANWKMHGSLQANADWLAAVRPAVEAGLAADVAVCAPAVYLAQLQSSLMGCAMAWGSQDVSAHAQGAYTGEVSAAMLRDFACRYALVGHSERRRHHAESNEAVAAKAQQALACGITPIVCVGESLEQRESGLTERVVREQLAAVVHALGPCSGEIVVAYEPVWAIGTGRTAEPAQVQTVHAVLRAQLGAAVKDAGRIRILYGGSVNAGNAAALLALPDVDGALVGGASLDAREFLAMVAAAA